MDISSDYVSTFISAQRAKFRSLERALPGIYGCEAERSGDAWALFATRWISPDNTIPFSRIIGSIENDSAAVLVNLLTKQQIPFAIEVLPRNVEDVDDRDPSLRGFKRAWSISWLGINLIDRSGDSPAAIRIDSAANRMSEFADVFVEGYEYPRPQSAGWHSMAEHGYSAEGFRNFLAYTSGEAAGCGTVYILDDIAFLDGAATIPRYRRRGVQTALLHHRIELARALGCKQVFSRTTSGSASERNMLAAGLRVVYRSQAFLPDL